MIEDAAALRAFAEKIRTATGVDIETAETWAARIGDTPEAETGNPGTILVRDRNRRVIGRVPASVLE